MTTGTARPIVIEYGPVVPSDVRHRRVLDAISTIGLCAILVFGPLAFGAVQDWAIFVLQAGASLLFLFWIVRQIVWPRLVWVPVFAPMGLFGVVVMLQVALGISAYQQATILEAMRYPAYAMLAVVAAHIFRSNRALNSFVWVLIGFGALYATFAIIQGWTSEGKLFWVRLPRAGAVVYGSYVNHAHFAGLMEMLTPFPLVLALTSQLKGSRRVLAGFAAAIMAGSIFLSHSRGGMVAFLGQVLFLSIILFRQRANRISAISLFGMVAFLTLFLFQFGGDSLTERIQNLQSPSRISTYADIPRMVAERPVLGWGLGAFPTAFPRYKSAFSEKFVNEAHSDYLQFLVETGSIGFIAVLWFILSTYRTGWRGTSGWRRDRRPAIRLAGLTAITGILIHSIFDFNLQIPANAALFYVLSVVAALPASLTSSDTSLEFDQ